MAHIAAKVSIIAISAVVATSIAIYESPQFRSQADRFRRRVAFALHQLGDNINPPNHHPRFNRPEDAYEFMQAQERATAGPDAPQSSGDPGVDADEASRRRQREELMYWNRLRVQREQEMQQEKKTQYSRANGGQSFDDFLVRDQSGAYVYNSGADMGAQAQGLVYRRPAQVDEPSRLENNPFSDANRIPPASDSATVVSETSNIYDSPAHEDGNGVQPAHPTAVADAAASADHVNSAATAVPSTLERELGPSEFATASGHDAEAYASIQAWAQTSFHNPAFYSPLPMTPTVASSEAEMVSEPGMATPADSMSVAEDIANDAASEVDRDASARLCDILSESEGMHTPASWSEVESEVSDEEHAF